MNGLEERMLRALANEFERRAAKWRRQSQKNYAIAGNDDELWTQCQREEGIACGLEHAATVLRHKIHYIQHSPRIRRKATK